MTQHFQKQLLVVALSAFAAIAGYAESEPKRVAYWKPSEYDGVGDSNRNGPEAVRAGHKPARTLKSDIERDEPPWEFDANFCLGYTGLKDSAESIHSFASLIIQLHVVSSITFDLQGSFAINRADGGYYFAGAGISWFNSPNFAGIFLSGSGGVYMGSALSDTLPAGKLLAGIRMQDGAKGGTLGLSAGPEAVLASNGVSVGLLFRIDFGFRF